MKRLWLSLGLLLLSFSPLQAQTLHTTLGGRPAVISFAKVDGDSNAGTYEVQVRDETGNKLWTSPRTKNLDSPFHFGYTPGGANELVMAGDLDGSGVTQLVVKDPQSDVRAPAYRFFRWSGGRFIYERDAVLVESPSGSKRFPFRDKTNVAEGLWVSNLRPAGRGQATAALEQYQGGRMSRGEAIVQGDRRGFRIVRWTQPLAEAR